MRHPQRTHPKQRIHASIEVELYHRISLLRTTQASALNSLSALVETIVFWGKGIYLEQRGEEFLFELRSLKALRLLELDDLHAFPPERNLHLTLDIEAIEFLDLLHMQYPVVFHSRTEALALILAYASAYCADVEKRRYLMRRLETVLAQHP